MADAIVIFWLLVRFHRILAWRWKCHAGEIDLVARRERTICFVEVKYLRRHDAATATCPRQQQGIIPTAEDFANWQQISRNLEWRFDLAKVGWPSPAFHGFFGIFYMRGTRRQAETDFADLDR